MPIRSERGGDQGHESVDHEHPSSAGLMETIGPDAEVPGTGIMGDETLVRDVDGEGAPGLYPAPPAHTGGEARPGPAPPAPPAPND